MYNLLIHIYVWIIKLLAVFKHEKATLWVEGRKDIFTKLENALSQNKNEKRIWIHVASLGEFEQGRPLIEAFKKQTPQYKIVLTFFSPSGYALRKNYPLADYVFYLPADTRSNALRFIQIVNPQLVIFVKYEFWFNYLRILKKQNITTLLVSAIFREKQFYNWQPYSYLLKKMLRCFTHIFVQNTPSVFLLKKHRFERVTCVGDTRIDRVLSLKNESPRFDDIEFFINKKPTFIGGSTWQKDENLILPLLNNPRFNNWQFILAPHDISKSNIQRLLADTKDKSVLYSELKTHSITQSPNRFQDKRILIIDNIGMLSSIYQYGTIAYIGGGFGSGIHNTLEPIAFGLPVIFGSKHQKFEEAIQLIETKGGFSIRNYAEFEKTMLYLLNKTNYDNASKAALDYVKKNQGATQKILDWIAAQMLS